MQTFVGVNILLCVFLTLVLDGVSCYLHSLAALPLWMGPPVPNWKCGPKTWLDTGEDNSFPAGYNCT
jgi:hypothetical protein